MAHEIVGRAWSRIPELFAINEDYRRRLQRDALYLALAHIMQWPDDNARNLALDQAAAGDDVEERLAVACELVIDGPRTFRDASTAEGWAEVFLRRAAGLPQRGPRRFL